MSNINFDLESVLASEENLFLDPIVLESEGTLEGKEVSKVTIQPKDFTQEKVTALFCLDEWKAKGFHYSQNASLLPLTKEVNISHVVAIKHILRFNDEYNEVIRGTTEMYSAQNATNDTNQATEQYNKEHPLGKPNSVPLCSGRGAVVAINSQGGFNLEDILLSKFYTPQEEQLALDAALEDIQLGVCQGMPHKYAQDILDVAANPNLRKNSKAIKAIINVTKRYEMPINSTFSFNYDDYGIKSKDETNAIVDIHNINRAYLTAQLGGIAKQAGVQPCQYAEFVILGFVYNSKFVDRKQDSDYTHGAIFVNYHHNKETHLPMGVVILCKPITTVSLRSVQPVGNHNSQTRTAKLLAKVKEQKAAAKPNTKEMPSAVVMPVVTMPDIVMPTPAVSTKVVKTFSLDSIGTVSLGDDSDDEFDTTSEFAMEE